jgi:type VI protein secretion system component VasK
MTREETDAADNENKVVARGGRKRGIGIFLVVILVLAMSGGALVSSYLENRYYEAQLATQNRAYEKQLSQQNAAQQAAQKKQGAMIERRLCSTLVGLSQLKAPSGNPEDNPSRAYEQAQQKKLSELSSDIGC